jgi:hypothetical protein
VPTGRASRPIHATTICSVRPQRLQRRPQTDAGDHIQGTDSEEEHAEKLGDVVNGLL